MSQCVMNTNETLYTCEQVEASYKCVESINGNCGKYGPWAFQFLNGNQTEIRSNASCYQQKFDQYFNQDGQCSFEDFKQ